MHTHTHGSRAFKCTPPAAFAAAAAAAAAAATAGRPAGPARTRNKCASPHRLRPDHPAPGPARPIVHPARPRLQRVSNSAHTRPAGRRRRRSSGVSGSASADAPASSAQIRVAWDPALGPRPSRPHRSESPEAPAQSPAPAVRRGARSGSRLRLRAAGPAALPRWEPAREAQGPKTQDGPSDASPSHFARPAPASARPARRPECGRPPAAACP
jgi:hypothetical protein